MAYFTWEQFFIRMQTCMILQTTFLAKPFATNQTNIRFLFCMHTNMALETALLYKCFIAHFAGKWTFVCMLACVYYQCLTGCKTFLTIRTFKWFLALSNERIQVHMVVIAGRQIVDAVRCTDHMWRWISRRIQRVYWFCGLGSIGCVVLGWHEIPAAGFLLLVLLLLFTIYLSSTR